MTAMPTPANARVDSCAADRFVQGASGGQAGLCDFPQAVHFRVSFERLIGIGIPKKRNRLVLVQRSMSPECWHFGQVLLVVPDWNESDWTSSEMFGMSSG